jgi:hypothetical protein
VSGQDALQNTKRNLRNLQMISYEMLIFPTCIPESLDVVLLAILFSPCFLSASTCVHLRFACGFRSRHFAACHAVGLAEADPFAVSLVSLRGGIYLRFAFIGGE